MPSHKTSPARSQDANLTPRKLRIRRTLSVGSPARSNVSARLTSINDDAKKQSGSFVLSPLPNRKSILTDNTFIDKPGRTSWWKKLGDNSQDVLEVLNSNEAVNPIIAIEEYVDVLSRDKKSYTLDLPESSDNESINSIVVPQRRLFTQQPTQTKNNYDKIIGDRDTLAKINKTNNDLHDKSVKVTAKNLFNLAPKRARPAFPEALLTISPNKTLANKTKEMVTADVKGQVRTLFGNRAGTKRKNMFVDFIMSESEDEIPDIQPRIFGFPKRPGDKRRPSSTSRGTRDHSPTSSVTTDIEMDDWKQLPSSTMVENQIEEMMTASTPVKKARISKLTEDIELANGSNVTANKTKLTNKSLISNNKSGVKSAKNTSVSEANKTKLASESSMIVENPIEDVETDTQSNKEFDISKNTTAKAINKSSNNKSNVSTKKNRTATELHIADTLNDESPKEKSQILKEKSVQTKKLIEEDEVEMKSKTNDIGSQLTLAEKSVLEISKSKRLTNAEDLKNKQQKNPIEDVETDTQSNKEFDISKNTTAKAINKSSNNKSNVSTKKNRTATELHIADTLNDESPKEKSQILKEKSVQTKKLIEEDEVEMKSKTNDIGSQLTLAEKSVLEVSKSKRLTNAEDMKNKQQKSFEEDLEVKHNLSVLEENKTASVLQDEINKDNIIEQHIAEDNEQLENEVSNDEKSQLRRNKQSIEDHKSESEDENNKAEDIDVAVEKSIEEENYQVEDEQSVAEDAADQTVEEDAADQTVEEDNEQDEEEDNEEDEEEDNEQDAADQSILEEQDSVEPSIVEENEKDYDAVFAEEDKNESEQVEPNSTMNESEDAKEQNNESVEEEQNESADNDVSMEQIQEEEEEETAEHDESEEFNKTDNDEVDQNDTEGHNDDESEHSRDSAQASKQVTIHESENQSSEQSVESTPNKSHDTTGRHRNKEDIAQSPEAVLQNMTNQEQSFAMNGRNKSIRTTKSMMQHLNIKQSLAPARDSTGFSDGTKNSSAEGSVEIPGWDSHRTTRKTIRQTMGREFSPRKSLRALVMEKSAKRYTAISDLNDEQIKIPQANSTQYPEPMAINEDEEDESSDAPVSVHEVSKSTRLATLKTYLQSVKTKNQQQRLQIEERVKHSLQNPSNENVNFFKVPSKSSFTLKQRANPKGEQNKPKSKVMKSKIIPLEDLPVNLLEDMKYKPPKRYKPGNASWITKRLYNFFESKLEAKYDYKARIRAEKLVETIYTFTKDLRRHPVAPKDATAMLKREMARLNIVKTHFEFYNFFHEYMPREIRVKVVPDLVNKISLPKHGVFMDILDS